MLEVLHAFLGLSVQQIHGHSGESPEKGQKVAASLLSEWVDIAGTSDWKIMWTCSNTGREIVECQALFSSAQ